MKKLMIVMAAVAMVGAAQAEASYPYDAYAYVSPYAAKDATPGDDHANWYSFYAMTQETAQDLMGVQTAVTYQDIANWLGKDFVANKGAVIEDAQKLTYDRFFGSGFQQYGYSDSLENYLTEECDDFIGVAFFDNGPDLAYDVLSADGECKSFGFDDKCNSSSTGWLAVEVPEPTSGLLMLLGMAGLALKRRRA